MKFDISKLCRFIYQFAKVFINDQKILFIIRKVIKKGLTYLDRVALLDLTETLFLINKSNVEGIWIEAGTALGGSAIVIASLKSDDKNLYLFDTFLQIPKPSNKDGNDVQERYKLIKSGKATGINNHQLLRNHQFVIWE